MQYLEIETPDGTRRVALAQDRLSIGRLAQNDVPLPYAQVSRQHAELLRVAGEWWIRDLGSTNGLHIGSHRVQQHRLVPGDRVLLTPDVAIGFAEDGAWVAGGGTSSWAATARAATTTDASPSPAISLPPGVPSPASPTVAQTSANAEHATIGPAPSQGALPPGPVVAGGDARDHYRRTMPAQRSPIAALTLHICQTCGQRTAPDVELCHVCHHSIARPCDHCHYSLLPIQDRCPRCQTPNPASVQQSSRRTTR